MKEYQSTEKYGEYQKDYQKLYHKTDAYKAYMKAYRERKKQER